MAFTELKKTALQIMLYLVNVNDVNVTAFMYHAGLITQLWTAALMRNSYEWIELNSSLQGAT